MITLMNFRTVMTMLAAWLVVCVSSEAQVQSRLSTRFLTRGEKALLEVSVIGLRPETYPEIPELRGVEIRPLGTGVQTRLLPGRRLEHVFEYLVSSYAVGEHALPAITVRAGGSVSQTEPIAFTVFNPDELKWFEAESGGIRFRYASSIRTQSPQPYEGETMPVEIKLFVPRDLFVDDWGIPDFQRDGVTAWRFQPTAMRGEVNLLGMPYMSVAYPSSLTPTRTGKVSIGPATIRLITRRVVMDGIMRQVSQEVNLTVPRLDLDAQPLPPGAPEGFENAIGSFKLKVSSSATEVQEGDPIPVDIEVSGTGNLDTIQPPRPIDLSGWKAYEPTTEQRGDERREVSGSTLFQQFLRPLELKPAVPSYRLVYFDPEDKTYRTLVSEPIPLQMTPAPAKQMEPPPAAPLPVERMTDILGLLHPAELTVPKERKLPAWLGHVVGGSVALMLLIKILWMRLQPRFKKDPALKARTREIRELQRSARGDDAGFLLSAGRFVERWLGENSSPEIQAVLAERDAICFRQDKPAGSLLSRERKNAILSTLRKAATSCIIVTALLLGTSTQLRAEDVANQAKEAYESARFNDAIQLWLNAGPYEQLHPDTLYNIGNACYRAGSPGYAALYYHRAIKRDPGHDEALQNLRFIERKFGAITVHRPEYQDALARYPLSTWKNLLWAGAWFSALALLVFPATRPRARARVAAIAILVIGPILMLSGALGWRYFPTDAGFAPVERQAVIVAEKAILHTDASRTSPEVIDAPPGSVCEVIQETGRWSYVAFATKTRGWILSSSLEKIIPSGQPNPPAIRKPKADGTSA